MRRYIFNIKIVIVLSTLLLHIFSYLSAQEKIDAREDARQHYLQGKAYYSQGRYEEATSEFEKAMGLISPPRIEFIEKVEEAREKALAPPVPPLTTTLPKKPQEKKAEEKETEAKEVVLPTEAPPEIEEAGEEKEYYIDTGDILDISVWRVADLSRSEVIVRPDGKISFPLIGDIKAEGLTLTQLDDIVTKELKVYVKKPEVSIMIRRFSEEKKKVVILGEILTPGVYSFVSPPTITELIASAGGYTKYAVLNSIMVISGDIKTKPEVKRIDFAQVLKRGDLSENIYLNPNTIVYVPRSFIGKFNTFLEVFQPAIGEYLQTLNARHLHHVVRSKGGI